VLLVVMEFLAGPKVAVNDVGLTVETANQNVVKAQYAVRGRLLEKSKELEAKMAAGENLPFTEIVRCNIGNPQALGQKPITFARQVLSLLVNPELINNKKVSKLYPKDVVARAKLYAGAVPSIGAYSDSMGIRLVREDVAAFIAERDGFPASADDIFLTDGASSGVKAVMQLMIRGPQDSVLCPIPQYPLYSATTTLLDGTLAPYYLDEAVAWGITEAELIKSYDESRAAGCTPRAIAVINPGNPTGQSLPQEMIETILAFAAERGLVVLADEVYQENVYGDAPSFTSFKRAYAALEAKGSAGDAAAAATAAKVQLVSFHSTSKGFFGECGLRGGYFELSGISTDLKAQLVKLASLCLCSNVIGQMATGLMIKPPVKGEPSYKRYAHEKKAILSSLHSRAQHIAKALNELPGISCNAAEGAMYLFPQLHLPEKAVAAADAAGYPADEFYCLRLLDATGLVVVPGSGFRQVAGTFHFRTTFLPPEEALTSVLGKLATFHTAFMAEFA